MAEPQEGPRRLYREPARVETIQCLSCGSPITLKTFGTAERVACAACGSLLGADESGALALLQAAARARQPVTLPLQARGMIDGVTWEVIGICRRSCEVAGETYPWEEFFLYNPYHGVRWLIHSLTDHHWSFGQRLDAAPVAEEEAIEWGGLKFKFFQAAIARVDYVEGEFTWQVEVGDLAEVYDYVAPPYGISIELSQSPDGDELNWTIQRAIATKEVRQAFNLDDAALPRPLGVGMLAPNPWVLTKTALLWWAGLLAVSVVVWLALIPATRKVAEARASAEVRGPIEAIVVPLTITGEGARILEVEIASPTMSSLWDDKWFYFEGMLVDLASEEAYGFEIVVISGTGRRAGSTLLGAVPPGEYALQISPTETNYIMPGQLDYIVTVSQGDFLHRYGVLIFGFVILGLYGVFSMDVNFEESRWANADPPSDP